MTLTKIAVLATLGAIIKKYKGNWGTASQKTLLGLLEEYHQIPIKRRMLSYHLADLRKLNLIKTIKRHHRHRNGQITLMSSATALTIKGCLALYRLGNRWALKQLNYLKNRYQSDPSSPAQKDDLRPGRYQEYHHQQVNIFEDPGFRALHGLSPVPPYNT